MWAYNFFLRFRSCIIYISGILFNVLHRMSLAQTKLEGKLTLLKYYVIMIESSPKLISLGKERFRWWLLKHWASNNSSGGGAAESIRLLISSFHSASSERLWTLNGNYIKLFHRKRLLIIICHRFYFAHHELLLRLLCTCLCIQLQFDFGKDACLPDVSRSSCNTKVKLS